MKLQLQSDFTLEVGSNTYLGTFTELTKKQEKDFTATYKKQNDRAKELNKIVKKVKKLERRIMIAEKLEDWLKIEVLEIDLDKVELEMEAKSAELEDNTNIEDMYKDRLESSIIAEKKEAILDIGKKYGYQKVFDTILKDITEKKEKN